MRSFWKAPKTYAVKHKNLDIRMNSMSGGIFTALSDNVIESNGIVYGCIQTEDFRAIHIRAASKTERNLMRGSKYIQSNMENVFKLVKQDLENGKRVLFSGTSCQVAGLKAFLNKDYDNLLCVDIVCHGVPSPKIWKEYIIFFEDKYGHCESAVFRNKKDFGWEESIETLTFKNGKGKKKVLNNRTFTTMFFSHNILRPCCFKCPYKSTMHPGDITIADYWGINKAVEGFNDNKGVSLVLINNEYGLSCFNTVKSDLEYVETKIENSMQRPLIAPFEEPKERHEFWDEYNQHGIAYVMKKYGTLPLKIRVRKMIKRKLIQVHLWK